MHWPTQLSMRIAPGPATRASGFRQRSADAALRRNLKKAKKGFGPLAAGGSPDAPGRIGRMSERWPRATGSEHHGVMHCCTKRNTFFKKDTCTPVYGFCACLQTSVVGHGQYRHTRNTTLNDTCPTHVRHMSKTSRPEATHKDTNPKKIPNGRAALLLKKASMSLRLRCTSHHAAVSVLMPTLSNMS